MRYVTADNRDFLLSLIRDWNDAKIQMAVAVQMDGSLLLSGLYPVLMVLSHACG